MTVESRPRARTALREATASDHARVDSLPRMQRLLSAEITAGEYGETLESLHALHQLLSAQIAESLGAFEHPTLSVDDLMVGLRSDLRKLRIKPGPLRSTKPAPPHFASPAAAIGAWYVLEGAALGGALIARHLHRHLGPDLPTDHFGRSAKDRWPRFLAHLETVLDHDVAIDGAIEGAKRCYCFTREILGVPGAAPGSR